MTDTKQTIVKNTGDALVVSFQNAKTPSVWRARIDALDGTTFKINAPSKGKYTLTLARAGLDGEEEIAVFTVKSDAEQALAAITDSLFNLTPSAPTTAPAPAAPIGHASAPHPAPGLTAAGARFWRRIYMAAFIVLFIFFMALIFIAGREVPRSASPEDLGVMLPAAPNSMTMGGDIEDMPDAMTGRPMSADDYFGE